MDIEGGYGGSSRSLFEAIRHLDRSTIAPEVWCRRNGPAQERCRRLDIETRLEPTMPKVSSLPLLSRNLVVYGQFYSSLPSARRFISKAAGEIRERFDLVHFNHEALFLAAKWLRPKVDTAFTMHIRTNLWDTPFARWQTRTISRTIDHLIFITENESATFERLAGRRVEGTVIYNAVSPQPVGHSSIHPAVPSGDLLRIACLSNYSWLRGIDRLIDIALALADRKRREIRFVVAGDMRLTRSLPGELGRIGRGGGALADYADHRGVGDMFTFLGHVQDPERVLAACDLLAKPTRESNPWGRDILEAMAAGVPALSVGTYDRFIEDGVTGVLQDQFDAADLARRIVALADNPEQLERMGQAARDRVAGLCDGRARAADLAAVWRDAANAR